MSAPTPVQVVRPRHSKGEQIAVYLAQWAEMLTTAFAVMLLTPLAVTSWHPAYGQSLAAVVIIRFLWRPRLLDAWSVLAPKVKGGKR